MIIQCKNCSRKFVVKDDAIPEKGRSVQCGYCSVTWHQIPNLKLKKDDEQISEQAVSVESIKASDDKTYKFLGSQWVELLPSGKTGLFAKKKIGKELDSLTGRIKSTPNRKKTKKIKEVDPSSGIKNHGGKLPDIYKPRNGLGFFGYIFLIIVISFSLIGFIKTFENDLLNYFPQHGYIFELIDQQLIYVSETVQNIIILVKDLINSY